MTGSTRRTFLKTALAAGAASGALGVGFPAIAAKKPIRIGAVQPFSGGLELFGNQAKLGIDLAVKEINAAGGILGRITGVSDHYAVVQISDNTEIKIQKSSVSQVVPKGTFEEA